MRRPRGSSGASSPNAEGAVAALLGTVTQVRNDVAALVRDMEAAILEANSFIDQLNAS